MDNSMDSMTTSINIHAMHHGQHALSAPEEEIINHYQNAQQEINNTFMMKYSACCSAKQRLSNAADPVSAILQAFQMNLSGAAHQ